VLYGTYVAWAITEGASCRVASLHCDHGPIVSTGHHKIKECTCTAKPKEILMVDWLFFESNVSKHGRQWRGCFETNGRQVMGHMDGATYMDTGPFVIK
jgi:hypothetical protein